MKAGSMIHSMQVTRATLGEEAYGAILKTLPPGTFTLVTGPLLALEWVPTEIWLPFHRAVLEHHFHGDEKAFRDLAQKVCEKDFNVFHKLVLKVASPIFVLERATSLFATYSDSGKFTAAVTSRDDERIHVHVALTDFETKDGIMGILTHAFVEKLLHLVNARAVEVRRTKNVVAGGKLHMELEISFSAR
jgi:hypothetical protein